MSGIKGIFTSETKGLSHREFLKELIDTLPQTPRLSDEEIRALPEANKLLNLEIVRKSIGADIKPK